MKQITDSPQFFNYVTSRGIMTAQPKQATQPR